MKKEEYQEKRKEKKKKEKAKKKEKKQHLFPDLSEISNRIIL